MRWRLGVVALAIAGVAGEAGAQTVTPVPTEADHWPCQPGCRLVESDELRVTDADGALAEGRLRTFDASSIRLTRTDGSEVLIDRERARQIDRRGDGLLNGILIGAAFGLGTIAAADPMGADVGAADYIGSTALWAGLGALFDHLHKGWTRVYDRPPTGSGSDKGSHAFWIAPSPRGLRVGFTRAF